MQFRTLNDVFVERTKGALKDKVYLQHKPIRGAAYQDITYAEFGDKVERLFHAFANLGISRGDRIAILSESKLEWLLTDYASLALGAITVPMFPTLTAKQVEHVVSNSGSKMLVVSNDLQLGKALKSLESCPHLETVIILNDATKLTLPDGEVKFVFFKDLPQKPSHLDFNLESSLARPEDVITIIYTSGTTGTPKGVMLTHANLLANIEGGIAMLPHIDEHDTALSFLPLCHAFERVAMYLFVVCGFTVALAESIDTVADNMIEIRPTVMTGVPRFYERIHTRIMRMRDKLPPPRRVIFDWALRIGAANAKAIEGKAVPLAARLFKPIADKLVLGKIRARTGGRVRFFVSGAAALPAEVGQAFTAFGLTLIEGYGMTECSPIISVTPYKHIKWGAVGKPLPNIEVTIAQDGEILTRGPHVMRGYYQDEKATAEVIDAEGWLHTGDIGEFDRDGYLKITDRKKHLFVSSGGKNIAPAHIESLLLQSKYIDQIAIIGDNRQYCTALIVPDYEAIAEASGAPSKLLGQDPDVRKLVDLEIERLQKDLPTYERIRKFAALDEPFSVENGMLTPTLKVKRKEVERRYSELIESLYSTAKTAP